MDLNGSLILPDYIQRQLLQIKIDTGIVLGSGIQFIIADLQAGSPSLEADTCFCGDRFKLRIPYAGTFITWEIIFNGCEPPDFVFHDAHFEPRIDKMASLAHWNIDNPQSLVAILSDLLDEFKLLHVRRLAGTSLQNHYDSFVYEDSEYSLENVEVYVTYPNGINDLSDCRALLLVTFQSLDGGRIVPQVFLSPNIQQIFDNYGGFRVQPWRPEFSLRNYIDFVTKQLNKLIDIVISGYERRRDYIDAFANMYKSHLLEYDVTSYSTIALLFNIRDFHFVLTIRLCITFPMDQPIFTYRSIYHVGSNEQPFFRHSNDYPYSPRWSAIEMAERSKDLIMEKATQFQRESVQKGQKWELPS